MGTGILKNISCTFFLSLIKRKCSQVFQPTHPFPPIRFIIHSFANLSAFNPHDILKEKYNNTINGDDKNLFTLLPLNVSNSFQRKWPFVASSNLWLKR